MVRKEIHIDRDSQPEADPTEVVVPPDCPWPIVLGVDPGTLVDSGSVTPA